MMQAMQAPSGDLRDNLLAEGTDLTKPRAARTHPEDDLQMAVVKYLTLALPKDCLWFHVPNGGFRNMYEAARLKRMGVRRGIPDLVFLWRGKTYGAELKSLSGPISDDQKDVHQRWEDAGHSPVVIIRSLDDMKKAIILWKMIPA